MSGEPPFGTPPLEHFVTSVNVFSVFQIHEFAQIRNLWKAAHKEAARVSGEHPHVETLRRSRVASLHRDDDCRWLFDRLLSSATTANERHFRFDLRGFREPLQLAEYVETDHFDWHMDFGAGDVSHRKLSISVQLSHSNQYEGGDLEFMVNREAIPAPRERGTAIIFPSFVMHRITPVTSGKRRSIVGWVSGPPYR